jgi:hypothetical protein
VVQEVQLYTVSKSQKENRIRNSEKWRGPGNDEAERKRSEDAGVMEIKDSGSPAVGSRGQGRLWALKMERIRLFGQFFEIKLPFSILI